MPIANIYDKRTNKYKIECDAVVESSWHDNSITGATQFIRNDENEVSYEESLYTTVEEAVKWGQQFEDLVTLYLYDEGVLDQQNDTNYYTINVLDNSIHLTMKS